MKILKKTILAAALLGFVQTAQVQAAVVDYDLGDLILGFQATSGEGLTQNYLYNVGYSVDFRNNGNLGSIGNINADLTAVFGENWSDRTDLYWGVVGVRDSIGNANSSSLAGLVDGDPRRTLYVSKGANAPGGSSAWTLTNRAEVGNASTAAMGLQTMFDGLQATSNTPNGAILDSSNSTAWATSWTNYNPTPGTAFGYFSGGIQSSFGAGEASYADLYRILSYTAGADPTGTVAAGSYETTFVIDDLGNITAVPEPSTYALITLTLVGAFVFRRRLQRSAQ